MQACHFAVSVKRDIEHLFRPCAVTKHMQRIGLCIRNRFPLKHGTIGIRHYREKVTAFMILYQTHTFAYIAVVHKDGRIAIGHIVICAVCTIGRGSPVTGSIFLIYSCAVFTLPIH